MNGLTRCLLPGLIMALPACGGGESGEGGGDPVGVSIVEVVQQYVADPALSECILESYMGMEEEPATTVTNIICEIEARDPPILSLAGIERFPMLSDLRIYPEEEYYTYYYRPQDPRLEDMSPVAQLRNLQVLVLAAQKITDLTFPDTCRLEALSINDNPIRDISAVSACTRLNYLDASLTDIENFHAVPELADLEVFYAADTGVLDWDSLKELDKLRSLDLSQDEYHPSQVHVLPSHVAQLQNLEALWLGGYRIAGVHRLSELPKLRELSLEAASFSVQELVGLNKLETLVMDWAIPSSVEYLAPLISLKALSARNVYMPGAEKHAFTAIATMDALEIAYLDHLPYIHSGVLAGNPSLQTVHIADAGLNTFVPLASVSALKHLYLGPNGPAPMSTTEVCEEVAYFQLNRPDVDVQGSSCE